MKPFLALILKDIRVDLRADAHCIFLPCYFALLTLLFPLALGPSLESLFFLAPGLLILAALLTSLNGLDHLFRSDFEDGFLQMIYLCGTPLLLYSAACLCGHFLVSGFLLTLFSPFIAISLGVPVSLALWPSPFIMAITLLCLTLIGGMLRALTLSAVQTRPLISLLALPLFIPPLIFATSAFNLAYTGQSYESPLLFLCALLLVLIVCAPYVISILLRWSLRS